MKSLWDAVSPFHPILAAVSVGIGLVVAGFLWWRTRRTLPELGAAFSPDMTVAAVVVMGTWMQQRLLAPGAGMVLVIALAGGAKFLTRLDSAVVAWLGAISLVGVWAAVPDTELALFAAGIVGVPVALRVARSVQLADRMALLMLVGVASWVGSAGRVEIVGGLGCAAMLIAPLPTGSHGLKRLLPLLIVHAVLVAISSRVITRMSWSGSAVAVVGVLVVATGAGMAAVRRSPTPDVGRELPRSENPEQRR